jgi:hypothetical protein
MDLSGISARMSCVHHGLQILCTNMSLKMHEIFVYTILFLKCNVTKWYLSSCFIVLTHK